MFLINCIIESTSLNVTRQSAKPWTLHLHLWVLQQAASRPARFGKLNRQFVETPACVWMVKGLQRRTQFHKIASVLHCNFGSSLLFPEKTTAYLPSPTHPPASLAHASLSASDNISIQALFSTQTPMSYLAVQARRINCWSTQSL